jgi:hypothetical protein
VETTITARYRLTADRMAEGFRVHKKLTQGWGSRAWLFACELLSIGCLGYASWNVELDHWTALLVIPMAAVIVAMFAFLNFMAHSDRGNRVVARFVLARMPDASRDIEWRFSDELLEQRTALAAASYRWELVTKVVEVPSGFLVSRGRFAFDWLPGEAFDSPVDARLFAGLAGSHAKEYVLIGECRTADVLPVEERQARPESSEARFHG